MGEKEQLVIDEVAAFSVTEKQSADNMTRVIAGYCVQDASACIVMDGMACVGGNTISFANSFGKVISNEFNRSRYEILMHNTQSVMMKTNVEFRNCDILRLVLEETFDVLFLDPEWGGPDYKNAIKLRLTIGDVYTEDFVASVFRDCPQVSIVAYICRVLYSTVLYSYSTVSPFCLRCLLLH